MNEPKGGAITMSTLTVETEPRSEEAVLHMPFVRARPDTA